MTQKEKEAMAREVAEWWAYESNPRREPIIIIDPEVSYVPLVERCGGSVATIQRESCETVKKEVFP